MMRRSPKTKPRSTGRRRETVGGVDDRFEHRRPADMTGADEVERGGWPRLSQQPWHVGRAADVEPAVDELRRDVGEPADVPEQLVIGEPGCSG